jgi:hypothetical protein
MGNILYINKYKNEQSTRESSQEKRRREVAEVHFTNTYQTQRKNKEKRHTVLIQNKFTMIWLI